MTKTVAWNIRVPADLATALDERAQVEGRDRSTTVRAALEAYLASPPSEIETRLAAVERAVAELQSTRSGSR